MHGSVGVDGDCGCGIAQAMRLLDGPGSAHAPQRRTAGLLDAGGVAPDLARQSRVRTGALPL